METDQDINDSQLRFMEAVYLAQKEEVPTKQFLIIVHTLKQILRQQQISLLSRNIHQYPIFISAEQYQYDEILMYLEQYKQNISTDIQLQFYSDQQFNVISLQRRVVLVAMRCPHKLKYHCVSQIQDEYLVYESPIVAFMIMQVFNNIGFFQQDYSIYWVIFALYQIVNQIKTNAKNNKINKNKDKPKDTVSSKLTYKSIPITTLENMLPKNSILVGQIAIQFHVESQQKSQYIQCPIMENTNQILVEYYSETITKPTITQIDDVILQGQPIEFNMFIQPITKTLNILNTLGAIYELFYQFILTCSSLRDVNQQVTEETTSAPISKVNFQERLNQLMGIIRDTDNPYKHSIYLQKQFSPIQTKQHRNQIQAQQQDILVQVILGLQDIFLQLDFI